MKKAVESKSILIELTRYITRAIDSVATLPVSFQINRHEASPTAPEVEASPVNEGRKATLQPFFSERRLRSIGEALLILLCFMLYAGQIAPDVNESHYLTKAKHFWNPNWCPGDIFLGSSFSHWLFYVSTGWLTMFVSLEAYAWIGRLATWTLLAFAWQRLSFKLIPTYGMAFVTAVFFLVLNDKFHMAGEWVVGGFEAKVLAYAFVLFALERSILRRWPQAWFLLGIACAFHVLVGGWAMLAMIASWVVCEVRLRNLSLQIKKQLPWLAIAFAISCIGIMPPLLTEIGSDPNLKAEANRIYVSSRITHHLRYGSFPILHIARFALVTSAWLLLARSLSRWSIAKPIQVFCFASLVISFGGLMLSGLEELSGAAGDTSRGLLRFYWFRLSDFAVPMAMAISSGAVVTQWVRTNSRAEHRFFGLFFVVLILMAAGIMIFEKNTDPRPIADQRSLPNYENDIQRTIETQANWKKVCLWIRENTPADSQFITPVNQQTFKWFAHRAEVASWKDVPQDAEAMIEWNRRISDLYEPQKRFDAGLLAFSDEELFRLSELYDADYLVLPQRNLDMAFEPTRLKQVYPQKKNTKSTYVVLVFLRGEQ